MIWLYLVLFFWIHYRSTITRLRMESEDDISLLSLARRPHVGFICFAPNVGTRFVTMDMQESTTPDCGINGV